MTVKKRNKTVNLLKPIRVVFASIVFISVLLMFLGPERISAKIAPVLASLQFTPSAISFFLSFTAAASFGCILILLLTVVFGRVYCSFLCPLGILHDGIRFLARPFTRKRSVRGSFPIHRSVRYGILALVLFSAAMGTVSLINVMDPYSLFGRFSTMLFRPAVASVRNLLVRVLETFEVYSIWPGKAPPFSTAALVLTGIVFAGMVILAVWKNRWYCNQICPVGTFLGLIGKISLVKIRLQPETCIRCGKCQILCRSDCIDIANKTVDHSRCVACFDCLSVCPVDAISYSPARGVSADLSPDPARRKFLAGSGLAGAALALSPLPLRAFSSTTNAEPPIMPPGAGERDRFCRACIGCGLCASLCPEQAIEPAFFEYGLQGLFVPVMSYKKGYCAYTCNLCGNVCPTGAIQPLPLEDKQLTQIGKVVLFKDRCIVHTRKQDCGACAEGCPTHAVFTVKRDHVHYPETDVSLCIGCGACEHMCPEHPKAIVVQGLARHEKANKPFYNQESPPIPQQTDPAIQEFPF